MTVEAIKDAIAALPLEDRHALTTWLNGLEYDAWDKQMVKDFSPGGRGMELVEKVKREVAEGKTSPFQQGRALTKAQYDARDKQMVKELLTATRAILAVTR